VTANSRPTSVRRSFRSFLAYGSGAPEEIVARLERDPDALIDEGRVLKAGDRCTVVQVDDAFVLKRYNLRGPLHTARHVLLESRAARCWRSGHKLLRAGLATPEPLAWSERRIGSMRFQSYLLMPYVSGPTLLDLVRNGASANDVDRVAACFASLWQGLRRVRAGHDDMKASNFIVGEDGTLWLIDLDGVRLGLAEPSFRRARQKSLARFMRNWRAHEAAEAAFRAALDTA